MPDKREMRYVLKVPARINLLGNPGDANEGDFATLSAAIDLYAGALVEPAQEVELDYLASSPLTLQEEPLIVSHQRYPGLTLPLPYTGQLDLIKSAINVLHRYSLEFREAVGRKGIHLAVWSDVPRQSGLGGSTLFVILTLAAMRAYYGLDHRYHNDYFLSELAQRAESIELGITCGFADRYVPVFGGLAYLDYRGKLHQREPRQEPYVTYERLDTFLDDLIIVVVSTGLKRESGEVHGRMRPRYLREYNQWVSSHREMPPMVRFMTSVWETAWRGKIALLEGDWRRFGELINENHRLVDDMMRYCGFKAGAGQANNLLIESALESGALGAKLTGAGGGGSVFALARPDDQSNLSNRLQEIARENGWTTAQVFQPQLDRRGLVVTPIA